jgi:thiol-disulfide isomerase/thioredoxin
MFQRKVCFLAVLFTLTSGAFATGEWETDYAKALAKAKAENKRVLLDFTGSDWCGPCIEFGNRVLSRPDFAAYADRIWFSLRSIIRNAKSNRLGSRARMKSSARSTASMKKDSRRLSCWTRTAKSRVNSPVTMVQRQRT